MQGELYGHTRNVIIALKQARDEVVKLSAKAPTEPNTGGDWVRAQADQIRALLNVANFLAAELSNELY